MNNDNKEFKDYREGLSGRKLVELREWRASITGRLTNALRSRVAKIKAGFDQMKEEARDLYNEKLERDLAKEQSKIDALDNKAVGIIASYEEKYNLQQMGQDIKEFQDRIVNKDDSLYGEEKHQFTDVYGALCVFHIKKKWHDKLVQNRSSKLAKIEGKQVEFETEKTEIEKKMALNGEKKVKIPHYDVIVFGKKIADKFKTAAVKLAEGAKVAGTAIAKAAVITKDFVVEKSTDAYEAVQEKLEERREAKAQEELEREAQETAQEQFINNLDVHIEKFKEFIASTGFKPEEIALMNDIYAQASVKAPVVTQVETDAKVNQDEYWLRPLDTEKSDKINSMTQESLDSSCVMLLDFIDIDSSRQNFINDREMLEKQVREANALIARKAALDPKAKMSGSEMTKAEFMKADSEEVLMWLEDVAVDVLSVDGMKKVVLDQSNKIANGSYDAKSLENAGRISDKITYNSTMNNEEVQKALNSSSKEENIMKLVNDGVISEKALTTLINRKEVNQEAIEALEATKATKPAKKDATPKKTSAKAKGDKQELEAEIKKTKDKKKSLEVSKDLVTKVKEKAGEIVAEKEGTSKGSKK